MIDSILAMYATASEMGPFVSILFLALMGGLTLAWCLTIVLVCKEVISRQWLHIILFWGGTLVGCLVLGVAILQVLRLFS